MLGFKKKVTVRSFWQSRLDGMFSGKDEPGWDALKASFSDPALDAVQPRLFYAHIQAMTIEVVSIVIAKRCSTDVSGSSQVFVCRFLKNNHHAEVESLVHRYSSAFGSSATDGIGKMVEFFSAELSGSRLALSTVEGFRRTLYLLVQQVSDMLRRIKLVPSDEPPDGDKPYMDGGIRLTHKLTRSLCSLPAKKGMSPDEMGKFLAEVYRGAFGMDTFRGLFGGVPMANGQTLDFALAEWYAFGVFIFTYCLWVVYNDRNKIFAVLDSFQPALLSSLPLKEAQEKRFLEIASDREKEYMGHFQEMKDGSGMVTFFSRVVARITGEFSQDCDSEGLPQPSDIAVTAPLSAYAMEATSLTKQAIRERGAW